MLDELLGDISDVICIEDEFELRGLTVKCWKYYSLIYNLNKPPIIAIHGGPAMSHNYTLPLQLLAKFGYTVIFYDQAGCGKSTNINDPVNKAPWLLTVDYYVEELKFLIEYFKLENFFIYGGSWGSMIAQEFSVLNPTGLLGVVLEGALSDIQLYFKTLWSEKLSTFPTNTTALLRKLIEDKDFDSQLYKDINKSFDVIFQCRQVPQPKCYTDSVCNETIAQVMLGDCNYLPGGVLEHWTITHRLNKINVPTLVLIGEYDTVSVANSQLIVDSITMAWPLVVIARAGHCKLTDEPQIVVEHVVKFLRCLKIIQ
jgi:L-proline amide hydrolase